MTTGDHLARVRALAEDAICPIEGRCACPTCGVVQLLIQSSLARRGHDKTRITVEPFDGNCAPYPYVASVRVDGSEVYRIHDSPDEALDPEVLADVERALLKEHRC